jgi:polyhydroxybutyrate depolymerase
MRALTHCLLITFLVLGWAPAATSSIGCGKTFASGTYRIIDQQVTRTYRVFVPSRYQPGTAYPLVVVFHGWGGDENEFLADENVTQLAEERGYIVVAPRGLGSSGPDSNPNSWSFRGSTTGLAGSAQDESRTAGSAAASICDVTRTRNFTYPSCKPVARNTCSWTQCQADDVAFTLALIHEIESKLCVDSTRVFTAGGSNGGMFSWELGQNAASAPTFRAIASIIGLPHRGYLAPPGKRGGMPVLVVTGTHDTTVPPGRWEDPQYTTTSDGEAYFYTGATAMTRAWGAADGCPYGGTPATSFDTGTKQADCRTYCGQRAAGWSGGNARAGWPKVLDCRIPMGHTYSFDWSWKLILDFFDAQGQGRR